MTWLKLSDDFGEDAARAGLTDREFRVHVEALLWSMRRETGGHLDMNDIKRGIEVPDPSPEIERLCGLGWWVRAPGGWRVQHSMEHQPEPEVIAKRRAMSADRVRRHRLKRAGLGDASARQTASGNGITSRVTGDGSGRDGSGRSSGPVVKNRPGRTQNVRARPGDCGDAECADPEVGNGRGWLADDDGTPVPCSRCKPHTRRNA